MEEKAIGLKVRSQDREVHAFEYLDGPRGLYEKGVGLILRPTGQIACPEVACKDLVTRYFAYGVPSIAGLSVVAHPIAGRWPECTSRACATGNWPRVTAIPERVPSFRKRRRRISPSACYFLIRPSIESMPTWRRRACRAFLSNGYRHPLKRLPPLFARPLPVRRTARRRMPPPGS